MDGRPRFGNGSVLPASWVDTELLSQIPTSSVWPEQVYPESLSFIWTYCYQTGLSTGDFPLFSYAIRYVFEHARSNELENRYSTYHALQEYVSKGGEIFKLHHLAAGAMSYYCGSRWYDCRPAIAGKHLEFTPKAQEMTQTHSWVSLFCMGYNCTARMPWKQRM